MPGSPFSGVGSWKQVMWISASYLLPPVVPLALIGAAPEFVPSSRDGKCFQQEGVCDGPRLPESIEKLVLVGAAILPDFSSR